MSHLTACPGPTCPRYRHRYSTRQPYCEKCGQRMQSVQACCAQEGLEDTGYCGACGMVKTPATFLGQEVG